MRLERASVAAPPSGRREVLLSEAERCLLAQHPRMSPTPPSPTDSAVGSAPSSGPTPEAVAKELHGLRAWLEAFLDNPSSDLPRLPSEALEIVELTQRPEVRLAEIARVLDRAPALAARVLRLANSPLYCTATPCNTLKDALVRLGMTAVRELVVEAALAMTVIRADGFADTLEQIRRHSSGVAWVSRFVARNTALEAENAFLVGLLKDLGLTVGLVALSDFLRREGQPMHLTPERWRAIEIVHEGFGERLLASWKLPPALSYVAGHHHALNVDGRAHPVVAVLMVAEAITNAAGWDIKPRGVDELGAPVVLACGERAELDTVAEALEVLHLTERHYAMLVADTQRVLETLEDQFDRVRT